MYFYYSTECNEPGGWHLRGSDWGCCGNYEGCCTYASIICYIHDALCRCCDVDFCGPTCKPEPDCFAPPTTSTCHTGSDCVSTSAEKPCNQNVECSLNAGGDDETLNDGIEGQFEEATKELNDRQNITPSNHTDLYKKFQSDSPQNARNVYGKNISEINTTGGRANSDNLPENGMEGSGETSFRVNEFT